MSKKHLLSIMTLLAALQLATCRSVVCAGESQAEVPTKTLALSLDAGQHDRSKVNVLLSTLIDAGDAKSVYVQYADGSLGRAQLVEPGMLNASWRGRGKKELHFLAPAMAKDESSQVIARLSESPVEGRTYVWTGEPRQSQRLSCGQCHQGLSPPTGEELRRERKALEETGKPPPLDLPRILPTSEGQDFRWHEKPGRYMTSACWECHGRHMVQYEYGQSLSRDLPWAPDPPHLTDATDPQTLRSVFHTVFQVTRDRAVSHPLPSSDGASDRTASWQIRYGFPQATVGGEPCPDILQQHVGILSEEAGKFIGRHCVLIDWVGNMHGERKVLAREERELTVKDLRGSNGTYAKWIDFVSTLSPTGASVRLDAACPLAGLRFVPVLDEGTTPEYRQSADWTAITFVSEGTTYTAVCLNHPGNPKPVAAEPAEPGCPAGEPEAAGSPHAVGYGFSAELEDRNPLLVRYRLWIQGGKMPSDEIQSMSDDFLEPIKIEAK